ncbi:MAG: PorV/PorQ family protein [Elusimicrobiota bacterium]
MHLSILRRPLSVLRPFAAFLLLSLLPLAARAGGPGTTSANFLKLGVGPRAAAMGEAFTGLADDVNAVAYNPAGLGSLRRNELAMMHNEYLEGIHHEWGAFAMPTDRLGTFGAAVSLFYVEPFAAYDENDQPTGKVGAQDAAYELAYANTFGEQFHVGAAAKHIRSRLDNHRAQATAYDAGVLYESRWRGLRLGASLLNLGGSMRFVQDAAPLPRLFKAGASFTPLRTLREKHVLTLAGDVTVPSDNDAYVSLGAEFRTLYILALRAGYNGSRDTGLGLSLGVGILVNDGDVGRMPSFDLDYSFSDHGDLSMAHRVGITFRFGQPKVPSWSYPRRVSEPWWNPARPQAPKAARERRAAPPPPAPYEDNPEVLKVNP